MYSPRGLLRGQVVNFRDRKQTYHVDYRARYQNQPSVEDSADRPQVALNGYTITYVYSV